MRFVDLIQKKKEGLSLTREELHFFIQGYVKKEIPDYQVSAFLMAICFQSMSKQETAWLCEEMLHSGNQMDLSFIQGVICDKHSTGGVGDKTSLVIAPLIAACGGKIAKMSGRGLGHTGGTLDKLESIPDFQISIAQDAFVNQVKEIGLAIISQSDTLVPADKMLYALRDVSATVDSVPLIASSIMSKKIASGADCILLDVKYGEGAFMKDKESARALAQEMIDIGTYFNKDTRAVISDMNQPLGRAIGNSLEVQEAILTLQGRGPKDFTQLCMHSAAIMLLQAHLVETKQDADELLQQSITTGKALEKFKSMISAQHGNSEVVNDFNLFAKASFITPITATSTGYLHQLHAMQIGMLAMQLGAGRMTKDDIIDPSVGIVLEKKIGDVISHEDVLAYVHSNAPLSNSWIHSFINCYEIHEEFIKQPNFMEEIM